MDIKDILNKLDTISEAPAGDPQRAAYDKFKADDAKTAAIEQVRKYASIPLNAIPRLANAIDPATGIIYYGDASGEGGGTGAAKKMPLKFMGQGDQKTMVDALTTAGLKVVPHEEKGLFGTSQYAKVEPSALAQVLAGPVAPAPGKQDPKGNDDAAKLEALVAQLEKTLGGQAPAPVTTTDPVKPPVKPEVNPERTTGQKLGIGAGIATGALAGQQLAKKAGLGGVGQAVSGTIGGAVGGLGARALQKEDVEFTSTIAQALTESFGYDYEGEQLDEYSMDQLGKDAGDFGRGAWNGVTLGTGDNIAAGVKSAFGKGTYKDELAKQTAASKEAETRSPWLYGAGNVAGSIAVPVPGGAIAGGLIKGASTAAKVARGGVALGTNLAAQAGIDKVKNVADTKTLGYDPSKYPTTPQEIMAFQKANGLTADGKIGLKTQGVLAKMGLTPAAPVPKAPTVAEDIKSLRERLAMIESGGQDYHVWLLEDNTVVGEDGVRIVDESVLSAIEWNQEQLNELGLPSLSSIGTGIKDLGGAAWKGLKGQQVANTIDQAAYQKTADKLANATTGRGANKTAKYSADQIKAMATAGAERAPSNAALKGQKIGSAIRNNAGKAAIGAAAIGGGAMALGGGATASPAGTTTGGGGSGAHPATTTPATTTPATTTPVAGGLTPEQQELIKQIKALALQHGEDDSPEWVKATGHMQVVLDKAEKASPAQQAADAKNDTGATPAPTGSAALDPAKNPNPATSIPSGPQTSVGADKSKPTVSNWAEGVNESDAELSRWLKIARG